MRSWTECRKRRREKPGETSKQRSERRNNKTQLRASTQSVGYRRKLFIKSFPQFLVVYPWFQAVCFEKPRNNWPDVLCILTPFIYHRPRRHTDRSCGLMHNHKGSDDLLNPIDRIPNFEDRRTDKNLGIYPKGFLSLNDSSVHQWPKPFTTFSIIILNGDRRQT